MSWLYYLLEANLYITIFYGFYRLFLHKETFYSMNRYYLILSSLLAFLIPFFQLGFLSKAITISDNYVYRQILVEDPLYSKEHVIFFFYSVITLIFVSKIIYGFRHIFKLLKKTNKIVKNGVTIIELANTKAAFSFFNLLFIDPELPQKNTILKHEMVHIKQKHSLDVLFFELIRSLSWFNPFTHFLKSDIKLLHEYLADEETTNKGIEKYDYALFLIENSYGNQVLNLTNQIFNSSILKRRISMLNQKKSAKWARLRLLLVFPVVGGMLCTSTMAFTKDYGTVDLYPKNIIGLNIQLQDTVKKQKAKELVIITEPIQKVKGLKIAPPPPPVEPLPRIKRAKKPIKSIAPPPPPVEPKAVKNEVLEIRLSPPPPPVEPKPITKNNELIKVTDVIIGKPVENGNSLKTIKIKRAQGVE